MTTLPQSDTAGGTGAGPSLPLEFSGVTKRFGHRTVLEGLTFPAGSVVGLLGPNGAGKSKAMLVLLEKESTT